MARADAVTVEARANIPRERPDAEVIPMGLDLDIFKPERGSTVPNRILAVAALLPQKGLDVLIEAMAIAAGEMPMLHLVIAGAGPQKSALERLAAEQGIASHVEFLGRVPRHDLPALYCSAAVFCHAARSDTFPVAVIEAMACGRPVLVSDSGALPEMVANAGMVHESGNAGALARQLVALMANQKLREELGAAAHEYAVSNYSDRKMSGRYLQLYDRLHRSRKSGRPGR
jgi:glycosyltransferase involved in cell wall biosynthesis